MASNRELVGRGFDLLAAGLMPFVDAQMTAADSENWLELLQARDAAKRGRTPHYSKSDPHILLRVITEQWRAFKGQLSRAEQSFASELRQIRNSWAHGESFSDEDAYRALDTMERLLIAVHAPGQAAEVRKQRATLSAETRRTVRPAGGHARSGPGSRVPPPTAATGPAPSPERLQDPPAAGEAPAPSGQQAPGERMAGQAGIPGASPAGRPAAEKSAITLAEFARQFGGARQDVVNQILRRGKRSGELRTYKDWLNEVFPDLAPPAPTADTAARSAAGLAQPEESSAAEAPISLHPATTARPSATPAEPPAAQTAVPTAPARKTQRWKYGAWAVAAVAAVLLLAAAATLYRQPSEQPANLLASTCTRPSKSPAQSQTHPATAPLASGSLTRTLRDPSPTQWDVWSAAFSPNGTLATGDQLEIYLWNTTTGRILTRLTDPEGAGQVMAISPNGTLATDDSVTSDNIYLWDTTTGEITKTLTIPAYTGVTSIAFGPNGTTLAVGASGGEIFVWNTTTGKMVKKFSDPAVPWGGSISSLAFAPDGTTLAADNGDIFLWNLTTGKTVATLSGNGASKSLAFAPDGSTLATGNCLWNITTGRITTLPAPRNEDFISTAFSPDGTVLAAGDASGHTYLWNTRTRKRTTIIDPATVYGVTSLAFAPDGTTLATTDSGNSNIYLWDITNHRS